MSSSISNSTLSTRQTNRNDTTGDNSRQNDNHRNQRNPSPNTHFNTTRYRNNDPNNRTRHTNNNNNNNNNNRDAATQHNRNQVSDNNRTNHQPKFKGAIDGMNGHIFGCFEEHGDRRQHIKTMAALQQYTSKLPHSEDFQSLFKTPPTFPELVEPTDPVPTPPATKLSTVQTLIFQEEIKQFVACRLQLRSNLVALWNTIIGQCTDTMKAKLESLPTFEKNATDRQCAWLLTTILSITLQFDNRRYTVNTLVEAYRQHPNQSVDDYRQAMATWADIIEHHGGTLILSDAPSHSMGTKAQQTKNKEATRQAFLAMLFLRNSDQARYGPLLLEMSNHYAAGRDLYPKDITTAYSLLLEYKTPYTQPRSRPPDNNRQSDAASINRQSSPNSAAATQNTATTTPSTTAPPTEAPPAVASPPSRPPTGITFAQAVQSPAPPGPPASAGSGTTLAQWAAIMAQHAIPHAIDPSWLLLDSQSTMSVFTNKSLLTDIRPAPNPIRAITNGGSQTSSLIGEFHGLGFPCTIWYNPESIANILSLAEIRRLCRITMDSSESPSISVHRPDGSTLSFHEHPSGLYVHSPHPSSLPTATYTFLSTVAANKKQFTPRQIQQADAARRLYRMLGRHDEKQFRAILNDNHIINCPLTGDDALRALTIYGPDIATLKGKMTRATAAARAPSFTAIPLPAPILAHHPNVSLCVDFFFIDSHCFLHTISRQIGFRTAIPVPDRKAPTILKEFRRVIHLYTLRGFNVTDIHGDHEFACVQPDLAPIHFNIMAADGHVGEVERSIRTIKERYRAFAHGLPFRRHPILLLHSIIVEVIRCLNQFPWKYGISPTLSPATIVTGCPRVDFNSLRIEFGAYVQLFDDHTPSNTPRARSLGAIALGPTGNAQGAHYFLSLASGSRISRHRWTELPITDLAIARVEALAFAQDQPLLQLRNFVAEGPDYPIDDDAYDGSYAPLPSHVDPDDDDLSTSSPFDPIDAAELADLNDDATSLPDDDDVDQPPNTNPPGGPAAAPLPPVAAQGAAPTPSKDQGAAPPSILRPPSPPHLRVRHGPRTTFADAVDSPHSSTSYYPPRAYQFFQYIPPKCTKAPVPDQFSPPRLSALHDRARHAVQFIFAHVAEEMSKHPRPHTQLSFREGLRRYGRDAEVALLKEYAQFDDYNVYEPLNATLLTPEQRRSALRAIELITEKRSGLLKGRTCVDGRPQRPFYDKLATSSPTIATDALILSIMIDAYEGRDVATADVQGAYLNAFMRDFVIMKFTGASVRLLCELNPSHRAFVVIERGEEVLYVRLIKALYGCVQSALLWYELFSTTLQQMGFTINPYDQCVANCLVEGSQCTVCWYVDDTKISHRDPAVVQAVIDRLESKFRTMKVTRGDSHVFLGMHIDYDRLSRTASISMRVTISLSPSLNPASPLLHRPLHRPPTTFSPSTRRRPASPLPLLKCFTA